MSNVEPTRAAADPQADARHRNRVNLIAAIAIAILLLSLFFVLRMVVDQRNRERCIDSGRRDCLDLGASPPREGVRIPVR